MSAGADLVVSTYTRTPTKPDAKTEECYFLRLSTGHAIDKVPAEFCDELDALTNDIDFLAEDDTFSKMVYNRGSFSHMFIQWFIDHVLPLYNAADKAIGHPLHDRTVLLRFSKNGRIVLSIS